MISDKKLNDQNLSFFLIFSVIIFLDQTTKFLATVNGFRMLCNGGIAFGLGSVGILAPLLGLFWVVWLARERKSYLSQAGLSLIISGGFSNLLDRIFVGCVRDFITIGKFPSFNLADAAITLGVIFLIGDLMSSKKQ